MIVRSAFSLKKYAWRSPMSVYLGMNSALRGNLRSNLNLTGIGSDFCATVLRKKLWSHSLRLTARISVQTKVNVTLFSKK